MSLRDIDSYNMKKIGFYGAGYKKIWGYKKTIRSRGIKKHWCIDLNLTLSDYQFFTSNDAAWNVELWYRAVQ